MSLAALSLSAVVPAFNEEAALVATVEGILKYAREVKAIEIIVVNDGSTDRTGELARSLPVTLVEHESNQGYGAAVKSGLRHARHDYVLVTDGDGTYPLEDIRRLLGYAEHDAMVVGARTPARQVLPFWPYPGRWLLNKLGEYLSRRKIPDLTSGFRVFRRDLALQFMHLYPERFSFNAMITLALATAGHRITFIPIDERPRTGKRPFRPITDCIDFMIAVVRICAYFRPLNVFVPVSLILLISGAVKGVFDLASHQYIGLIAIALGLAGLQLLVTGLLADLLNHRGKA